MRELYLHCGASMHGYDPIAPTLASNEDLKLRPLAGQQRGADGALIVSPATSWG